MSKDFLDAVRNNHSSHNSAQIAQTPLIAGRENLRSLVRDIPDFPIPGVLFRDITPLLASPEHFKQAIAALTEPMNIDRDIDFIAGIESRGFILASALAIHHEKGFLPIRKKGKLPPPVEHQTYSLEYGQDAIEMKRGTGRVLIVDDVLATGGTINAAISLCKKAGYTVAHLSFLINLKFLNQFEWQGSPPHSVIQYE